MNYQNFLAHLRQYAALLGMKKAIPFSVVAALVSTNVKRLQARGDLRSANEIAAESYAAARREFGPLAELLSDIPDPAPEGWQQS